jgi:4-amino-4-deoxy-L-arabinose transferase-like glycosyltransferase
MMRVLRRSTPRQATLWLIASFSIVRLLVGSTTGLSVDEAHYALYGLHLDWSYFDHPPMIGWLQALVLPFSESTFALRVIPVFLFASTGMVLYRLTRNLFPQESPWIAFISVLLLQSGMMFQLIGIAMLPDTPLLLLGLLVLLVLHRALTTAQSRYWLVLGLLLGLAGLSKYTAVTLVLTVLVALAFTRQWRQLRSPAPWLAMLISALTIMPILYWNACHDWMSFAYQLHHGTGNLQWQSSSFLLSEAAQLLAYGFAVIVFCAVALIAAVRDNKETGVRYCLALSLPVLLLFGWNAGYVATLPHWTSLGWAALLPLAARWLYQHWHQRLVRIGFYLAMCYSVILMAVLFSEMISPRLPFADNQYPMQDLFGWQEAARHAETLRAEMPASSEVVPTLFTENWTHASRLAWYARPTPVVVLDARNDQFDLWFGSPQKGANGILVLWPDADARPATGGAGQFAYCSLRDKLPIISNGHLLSTFTFYACHDFHK